MESKKRKFRIVYNILAGLLAALFLIPLLWMFFTSFKTLSEAMASSAILPRQWTMQNYIDVLNDTANSPIIRWFINTVITTTLGTIIVVIIDILAAYSLARLSLPGKKLLIGTIFLGLTIPGIVTLFPNFFIMRNLGLVDTYVSLIVPYTASTFGVYLLYSYIKEFPEELEEAARIDGASHMQILRYVIIPALRPSIATLSIITFLAIYNDFLWPLLVTNEIQMKTITVGIANLIQGANFVNPAKMMASTVIATIPALLIFLYANKYFVRSVTKSGLK